MTNKIVLAAVGLLIAVALFGSVMTSFQSTSTVGWPTTIVTIWNLLPLLGLLGLALLIFAFAKGGLGNKG